MRAALLPPAILLLLSHADGVLALQRTRLIPWSATRIVPARSRMPTSCDSSPVPPTMAFRKDDPAEITVPDVSLTRSVDGSTGTATVRFDDASILARDNVWDKGLVTGLWFRDEEGVIHTADVSISWTQGRPTEVVGILVLKNEAEWNRFMRFMKRYAEVHDLAFAGA